jgi:hypothetical protein
MHSIVMRQLHFLTSGQKIISTKVEGHYEMLTILCYQIPILNYSKNCLFITYRWYGTILMMPDIFETEQHLKLPSNLACLIPF